MDVNDEPFWKSTVTPAAKAVTLADIEGLMEKIVNVAPRPHRCMVHPTSGICLGCGRKWEVTW